MNNLSNGSGGGTPLKGLGEGPNPSAFRSSFSKSEIGVPQRNSLDFKNIPYIRRFLTDQGKIFSRRITRLSASHQRKLTKAVKQARILGLLGFIPGDVESGETVNWGSNSTTQQPA